MTKCTVLKNFRYSLDGVNSHAAKVGVTPDPNVPEDLIAGLSNEGYISVEGVENKMLTGADETGATVKLPTGVTGDGGGEPLNLTGEERDALPVLIDNDPESDTFWRKMSAADMKELAAQLTDETISNKSDAEAAIEMHLESLEQA